MSSGPPNQLRQTTPQQQNEAQKQPQQHGLFLGIFLTVFLPLGSGFMIFFLKFKSVY